MDEFEKKYGFREDENVQAYHKSRRMFCIYEGELRIAEPNLPYSHATWFEREGWMTKEDDALMDSVVRGIVDDRGDIYFYIGHDFEVNERAETIFFQYLTELVERLNISSDAEIFGGAVMQEPGTKWPPRKTYGKVESILSEQ